MQVPLVVILCCHRRWQYQKNAAFRQPSGTKATLTGVAQREDKT